MAKRIRKPPTIKEVQTPKRPKIKADPEPIYQQEVIKVSQVDSEPVYEQEEEDVQEEQENQEFIDDYINADGDYGGDNEDEEADEGDDNVEDTNEDEEVIDHEKSFADAPSQTKRGDIPRKVKAHDKRLKSNCPVEIEGSVATTMQGTMGRRSTLFIIGDYLYCNPKFIANKVKTRCRNKCRRYAYMEPKTLRVIKLTGEHICILDPDLKFQIQMESEMKDLAAACTQGSKAKFKEIYDTVCNKNPAAASRITFSRMYKAMDGRWRQANPSTINKM